MRDDTETGFREFGGNEETIGSKINDPSGIRLGSVEGAYGKVSMNRLVPDPARPGEFTQLERVLIVGADDGLVFQIQRPGTVGDAGMMKVLTVTTRGAVLHVPWFNRVEDLPPIPPPPPDGTDPTHGIPTGDFVRILQVYGFESDWQDVYAQGRVTWVQVIEKQDERDDYATFPKTPVPPVITPEERAERVLDVAAMQGEWPGMDLNNVESYLQGRSSPKEFHDENAYRAGFHNLALHRPWRPY
jgi:hypothetical protein